MNRQTSKFGKGLSKKVLSRSQFDISHLILVQSQAVTFIDKNDGKAHVSVWRQKERVRIYLNDQKVWDVPKALAPTAKVNIIFYVSYVGADYQYFVSNLRLAVGAPDTRNKRLTEGKWVTYGIQFDVNSDKVRGESYGTLKEIHPF